MKCVFQKRISNSMFVQDSIRMVKKSTKVLVIGLLLIIFVTACSSKGQNAMSWQEQYDLGN